MTSVRIPLFLLLLAFAAGCSDETTAPPPVTLADVHAYVDAHFSVERLADAFGADANEYAGTFYYGVTDHEDLSLWVSREDDEQEFYANAHHWNQFSFGWDDFQDPRVFVGLGATVADLQDPRTSPHREECRSLWDEYLASQPKRKSR